MQKVPVPDRPHFWHELSETLVTLAKESAAVANAGDIASMRLAFGDLSLAFRDLAKATGIPPGYPNDVLALHCPMFLQNQGGAVWLQTSDEVRNPYMGSTWLGCFDERTAIPVTGVTSK